MQRQSLCGRSTKGHGTARCNAHAISPFAEDQGSADHGCQLVPDLAVVAEHATRLAAGSEAPPDPNRVDAGGLRGDRGGGLSLSGGRRLPDARQGRYRSPRDQPVRSEVSKAETEVSGTGRRMAWVLQSEPAFARR